MNRLVLDFEYHDPLSEKLGNTWPFGLVNVLGCSLAFNDEPVFYTTDMSKVTDLVDLSDELVCHSFHVEIGILVQLGIDISNKIIIDTLQLARLVDNCRLSYSLNNLAADLVGEVKSDKPMAIAAIEKGLYPVKTQDEYFKSRKEGDYEKYYTTKLKHALKWCKKNMHICAEHMPELVSEYCIQDIILTQKIHDVLHPRCDAVWLDRLSRLNHIALRRRKAGIPINIERCVEVSEILGEKLYSVLFKIRALVDDPAFDPNKPTQLIQALDSLQIEYPKTDKGNPSVKGDWLESQPHEFCQLIKKYRRLLKAKRDYCDSVLTAQELLPEQYKGRVYPEFTPLGAAKTGRYSCRKPNILQIPRRDEETGPLIRSMYIPETNQQWLCRDYSAQEPRIALHFAYLMQLPGACEWVQRYLKNPSTSRHDTVEELTTLSREVAKVTGLTLDYGGGVTTVSERLGLSVAETQDILATYYEAVPYTLPFSKVCAAVCKDRGYVKTILGRKLEVPKPLFNKGKKQEFYYQAGNRVIQGSAADMMYLVELELDRQGLPMLFSVYDELNCSVENQEQIELINKIMINILPLEVPMITEGGCGDSWGSAK